jgi:adenylosuccinate lyase
MAMDLTGLTAISPVDGRYGAKTTDLRPIFSEFGLIRYRVLVEIRWLQTLSRHPGIPEVPGLLGRGRPAARRDRRAVRRRGCATHQGDRADDESRRQGGRVFPQGAGHRASELNAASEFIHFACTSEDINNLAHGLMLSAGREQVLLPEMDAVIAAVRDLAHRYADQPMLSRTHGQPATPTTLGKEMANLVHRLRIQRDRVAEVTCWAR